MLLELIILFCVMAFCLKCSNKQILCMLFLFLPIHGTIKTIVFNDGGNFFSMWKELCIAVMFVRTYRKRTFCFNIIFNTYLLMGAFLFIYVIIGYNSGFPISTMVKMVYMPCLLTLVVSKIEFSRIDYRNFLLTVFIGSIIINITGVVDFVSPVSRMLFRTIMGVEYKLDSFGNVYYEVSSFKIMGYDRACGLMMGGPNQFGVFNSGILFLCIISFLYLRECFNSRKSIFILHLTTYLSAFCLLVSFSRAGMAILLIALIVMGIYEKRIRTRVITCIFVIIVLCVFAVIISPQVSDVVLGTLTGKEASSAERASMTESSFTQLMSQPWGHGFGVSSTSDKRRLFAESTFINMAFEFGIIGVFLIVLLLYVIYKNIKRNSAYNILSRPASAFLIGYTITCVVSVNPFENPFIYYAWTIFGIGLMRMRKIFFP